MDRWATDPDFWVRRSSLLAQLRPIRQGATLDRFLRYADPMLEEPEFFIRKAIGWVLRDTARSAPTTSPPGSRRERTGNRRHRA